VVGGLVYIGSLDGTLYALDANTGSIVWETQAKGPIESSPAVSDGAIYFNSEEPLGAALYKVDANTGAVIWKQVFPYNYSPIEGGTEMLGSPSVAAGMVFTSSDIRAYYAVNATTGNIVWNFSDPAASEFIYSSPIYVNGDLYFLDKYNIACLNAMTGQTIWSAFTGDELYVSPSYASGYIYVVTSERHIYVLDTTENGTRIATATTPSSSWSSPTIANGMLYIGCNDWNVYCYANTAAAVLPSSTSTPTPSPTLPPSQRLTLSSSLIVIIVIVIVVVVATTVAVVYVVRKRAKK